MSLTAVTTADGLSPAECKAWHDIFLQFARVLVSTKFIIFIFKDFEDFIDFATVTFLSTFLSDPPPPPPVYKRFCPKLIIGLKSLHFILAQCGNSIIATVCPLKFS